MKVLSESSFKSITVVLETRQEADIIWHMLNNTGNWHEYTKRKGIGHLQSKVHSLWLTFNASYRPDNE